MLTYERINLFHAPKDAIIIHACNAKGMWRSGIAAEFAQRYPNSYSSYKLFCKEWDMLRGTSLGKGRLSTRPFDEDHYVGWIVTSQEESSNPDSPDQIKINTTLALVDLCKSIYNYLNLNDLESITIYSPKFNSGLFHVPWTESELILKTVLFDYPRINWVVCDPEMK